MSCGAKLGSRAERRYVRSVGSSPASFATRSMVERGGSGRAEQREDEQPAAGAGPVAAARRLEGDAAPVRTDHRVRRLVARRVAPPGDPLEVAAVMHHPQL